NGRPYQELKFRDSDYWTEMADELELAIAAIKQQLAQELANDSSPQSASQTTTPATGNAGRGIVIASDEGLPTTPAPTPSSNS
ncbi:MAG: hypothetical protein KDB23_15895, partial [Planctomycetales bacterium]|nr:hypothetical protein [Planctomycetales bacterium]